MKITISAELTPEQVQILSTKKGYSEEIQSIKETETEYPETTTAEWIVISAWVTKYFENITISNPQSREEYLKEVYTWIITADTTNVFIQYAKEQRAEAERIEQEEIRANVVAAITSSIE